MARLRIFKGRIKYAIAVLAATVLVYVAVYLTEEPPQVVYNPDMTDWWADMIESLDGESSAVWTEPGWEGKVWVGIDDIGDDTYRISLHGITAAGSPITYTITEMETAYHKYGPALEDGTMDSRIYQKSLEDIEVVSDP